MAVIRATLVVAAITAAAFGIVSALPQPTKSDRIAVAVLHVLETHRGLGSTFTIGGRSFAAQCRRLPGRRSLVRVSDGTQFVLRGVRVRPWRPAGQLASARRTRALPQAADADLFGSYRLYTQELALQLQSGSRVETGGGRDAYRLILDQAKPRAVLLVDRATLQPIAVRVSSRSLSGQAVLSGQRPATEATTC
jgi:hypothetical protein